MITWHDALALSKKRWQRKRIFGNLKYSAPLFLLLFMTMVTLNVVYVLIKRAETLVADETYPHPAHVRVFVPKKSGSAALTPSQIAELKAHRLVRQTMTAIPVVQDFFADLGDVRHLHMTEIYGYKKEFFDLYRLLPPEKDDPQAIPILLGRDLLSLTWQSEEKKFVRNEQKEMARWLGRTFLIYLNPLGNKSYEPKFELEQTDRSGFISSMLKKRQAALTELERINPDLAQRQDAVFMKVQVVGFIRPPEGRGSASVLTTEMLDHISELSALRWSGRKKNVSEDDLKNISLLVDPENRKALETFVHSQGLEVYDWKTAGIFSALYTAFQDETAFRVTVIILAGLYFSIMTVIIYLLFSGQVKDSVREIGLLRCIGAQRTDIMRIFAVMNLIRLARMYALSLLCTYLLLLAGGFWSARSLNAIKPEHLINGTIPDFLINRVEYFSPFWLMAPPWIAVLPILLLVPTALAAAALPIRHAMSVQPSEALRD